ncbi:MAG: response regulator [Elusimicrobia bacterium]|nr:response regulator [Elusimicrobiota bacterium]
MRILIAEDDEPLRTLLMVFLSDMGHQARSAENGTGLVEMALAERPDLIITDLHMPEMAGDSMIAMIDIYPDLSGIPVIIVTGATEAEIADMGIPRGIKILPKPFDFDKITAAINAINAV